MKTVFFRSHALANRYNEKQKALGFYNQALPLWRAANDRSGEATTLANIGKVYLIGAGPGDPGPAGHRRQLSEHL